jgi:NADH:quinone reductase (non-electrogenic)
MAGDHKQVLILGGGFGGLHLALALDRSLARDDDVTVTLVNDENYFQYTPMLPEVVGSDIELSHVVVASRKLFRHVNFFKGAVERIDLGSKRVTVTHGLDAAHVHEFMYDYLVIALGSITDFHHLPGVEENALTMKTLGDAIRLRNRMIEFLEEADREPVAEERSAMLTFVVAGGGFSGAETAAAMNDLLREACKFYRSLSVRDIKVVLAHPGHVILPELDARLGAYAQHKMANAGVDIRLNTKVSGYVDGSVRFNDGSTITAKTLLWTAGVSPSPLVDPLPCKKERARIGVNDYMELPEWPGVWALGDCAMIPIQRTGQFYPPTAQHAEAEAKILAENITAAIRGGEKKPFVFRELGKMAVIGRRSGVATVLGFDISGLIAWMMWRSLNLSLMPGAERKLRIMLDWGLDLLFAKDLVQVGTQTALTISTEPDTEASPVSTTTSKTAANAGRA